MPTADVSGMSVTANPMTALESDCIHSYEKTICNGNREASIGEALTLNRLTGVGLYDTNAQTRDFT